MKADTSRIPYWKDRRARHKSAIDLALSTRARTASPQEAMQILIQIQNLVRPAKETSRNGTHTRTKD
jgi:hypothetical protein